MSVYFQCPRCGQGAVRSRRIGATAEILRVCDECEATWLPGIDPTPSGFVNLEDELARRGLPLEWKQLDEVE